MKPHVICLMTSSVDGRTRLSRWRPTGTGGALFEQVHDELAGDAWLVGRVTGQEFAKGKPYPASMAETFPREPWFARRDAKAYGVVLDAHGKIGWGRSDIGGDPIVVALTEAVSDAHLAGLRSEGVSYFFAGKSELDLALVLDILNRELGIKRLLLEGGGGANGAFLRAGLIDEFNLDYLPGGGRRQGRGERVRFSGKRDRPARTGHRHDAGEQPRFGRGRDAAALPARERGSGSRRGPITATWPDPARPHYHHRRRRRRPDGCARTRTRGQASDHPRSARQAWRPHRSAAGGASSATAAEGGAEFVHGEAPVTRALLREAGVSLLPIEGTRRTVVEGKLSSEDSGDA